ncbi:MAG: DUF475 domain-containing protein [Cyanobacteriota bacterium]|nr:DUF475 domain-containing protein [Cyanobacteriota bacterium]
MTPLLHAADQWGEVLLLLPLLVALEAVLSADNAIALAAISRRLHDPARQRQALNLGLLLALVFRLLLIALARWVLDFWPLELAASAYLLWLCGRHLLGADDVSDDEHDNQTTQGDNPERDNVERGNAETPQPLSPPLAAALSPSAGFQAAPLQGQEQALPQDHPQGHHPQGQPHGSQHGHHHGASLGAVVATLALTDLAFSLDSVAAAVAVTDRLLLVMAGGVIGVIALRLTAELFIRWLEVYAHLETAGYLAVGLVGLRLLLRLVLPSVEIPEWTLLLSVVALFIWGFSARSAEPRADDAGSS